MITLDVVGFRLVDPEDSPVLILRERNGTRVLPIWISSIDATGVAAALEDNQFERPLTHDLLSVVLDVLTTDEEPQGRATITEMSDGVFFARIAVGDFEFDARPSDAVAVALRLDWPVECPEQLMDEVGVELDEQEVDEVEKFREFLDSVNPDDFESDQ